MVTDYEAAWVELSRRVAGKTQHGREQLLAAMAEIAAECRVPAGELSRLLRLHGVEVERARSIATETDRAELGTLAGGFASLTDAELAGHHWPGGHDGRSNGSSGNGRARG